MREYLSKHEFGKNQGFRWRNASEISRIEGFSDAVFGFAVTLLVVSLEVPKTYGELMEGMHGFFAFAIAFSILFVIWTNQYKFFRQYGLQDGPTLWLNAGLLFVVLFFTYPLKFLFTWMTAGLLGRSTMVRLHEGDLVPMVPNGKQGELMVVYGLGYLAVFTMLFLLHLHAWRRRHELELSPVEQWMTRHTLQEQASQMVIAGLSIALAVQGHPAWAGYTYLLIMPVLTINGMVMGRIQRERFGEMPTRPVPDDARQRP